MQQLKQLNSKVLPIHADGTDTAATLGAATCEKTQAAPRKERAYRSFGRTLVDEQLGRQKTGVLLNPVVSGAAPATVPV